MADRDYVFGFKNRVSPLFYWMISFFGRSRLERTITAQQVLPPSGVRRVHSQRTSH